MAGRWEAELFQLVKENKPALVEAILARLDGEHLGVLGMVEDHGWTMAHMAAKNGSLEMLRLLHKFRAPLTLPTANSLGCHPIHLACDGGHKEVVSFLLRTVGEDVNVADAQGNSPLTYAGLGGRMDVVGMLMDAGADLDVKDNRGHSLMQLACAGGRLGIVHRLLSLGLDVDQAMDDDKLTPLMVACSEGHVNVAALLLNAGADVNQVDANGMTALHWACTDRRTGCITLLLLYDADVNLTTKNHETPLHIACKTETVQPVAYLLGRSDVDIKIEDCNGKRALEYVQDMTLVLHSLNTPRAGFRAAICARKPGMLLRPLFLRHLVFGFASGGTSSLLAFAVPWVAALWGALVFALRLHASEEVMGSGFGWVVWVGDAFQAGMWVGLVASWLSDPGFLDPTNAQLRQEFNDDIERMANEALGSAPPQHTKLCTTCHIERPLRSKHCAVCDRCVLEMDHHCAFVANCVGERNWRWFFLYIVCVEGSLLCLLGGAAVFFWKEGFDWMLVCSVPLGWLVFPVGLLVHYQSWLALNNLLTNEHSNWYRYEHMVDTNGQFHNPFDLGLVGNLMHRFCPSGTRAHTQYSSVVASAV